MHNWHKNRGRTVKVLSRRNIKKHNKIISTLTIEEVNGQRFEVERARGQLPVRRRLPDAPVQQLIRKTAPTAVLLADTTTGQKPQRTMPLESFTAAELKDFEHHDLGDVRETALTPAHSEDEHADALPSGIEVEPPSVEETENTVSAEQLQAAYEALGIDVDEMLKDEEVTHDEAAEPSSVYPGMLTLLTSDNEAPTDPTARRVLTLACQYAAPAVSDILSEVVTIEARTIVKEAIAEVTNEAADATSKVDVPDSAVDVAEITDVTTEAADVLIEPADVITGSADVLLATDDVITETADVHLKSADVTTESADATLEVDASKPAADLIKSADVITETADVHLETADVTTKSADALTKIDLLESATDASEFVDVAAESASATSKGDVPETADAVLKSADVTTASAEATTKVDALESEDVIAEAAVTKTASTDTEATITFDVITTTVDGQGTADAIMEAAIAEATDALITAAASGTTAAEVDVQESTDDIQVGVATDDQEVTDATPVAEGTEESIAAEIIEAGAAQERKDVGGEVIGELPAEVDEAQAGDPLAKFTKAKAVEVIFNDVLNTSLTTTAGSTTRQVSKSEIDAETHVIPDGVQYRYTEDGEIIIDPSTSATERSSAARSSDEEGDVAQSVMSLTAKLSDVDLVDGTPVEMSPRRATPGTKGSTKSAANSFSSAHMLSPEVVAAQTLLGMRVSCSPHTPPQTSHGRKSPQLPLTTTAPRQPTPRGDVAVASTSGHYLKESRQPQPMLAHTRTPIMSDLLKSAGGLHLVPTATPRDHGRALRAPGPPTDYDDVTLGCSDEIRELCEIRRVETREQLEDTLLGNYDVRVPLPRTRKLQINTYSYEPQGAELSLCAARFPEQPVTGASTDPVVQQGTTHVTVKDLSYQETLARIALYHRSVQGILITRLQELKALAVKDEAAEGRVLAAMAEVHADSAVATVEQFNHVLLVRKSSLLQAVDRFAPSTATATDVIDVLTGKDGFRDKTL